MSLQLRAKAQLEIKRRQGLAGGAYARFKAKYRDNWAGFVTDCIKWEKGKEPADYQLEIIRDFQVKRRMAVRGPHGLGKTGLASWVVLAFALTSDGEDWKAVTTASAWRQLQRFLWPEIRKWARLLDWQKIGRPPFSERKEMLALSLKLETGEAFAAASDNPSLIEGAHAEDRILYLFDESKAIIDDTFDAAEGAFSTEGTEAYALAISTPGEPIGRFYDIHKRKPGYEDWRVRHVKLNEAIAAGRISKEWADQRKLQWGENSAVYQNRVVGEFAANDEDTVIPLSWIEKANERWYEWRDAGKPGEFSAVGLDVGGASEAGAKTVFALSYDKYKVDDLRKYNRGNPDIATMETAGRLKGILDAAREKHNQENPDVEFEGVGVVDVIGIGAGVYHRAKEQGVPVLSFNAAEKAVRTVGKKQEPIKDKSDEFGFVNMRAAGWWTMRELLDPVNGEDVALPPDDELTGELTTPKWSVKSGARIQVEGKEDIAKRLKRSTDSADAVIEALTGPDLCKEYGTQWKSVEFLKV